MRKTKRLVAMLLCAVTAMSTLVACDGGGAGSSTSSSDWQQQIDPNKTTILFSVFNGGFGYEWAMRHAKEWNKTNEKYEVIVVPDKDEWYTFSANLEAETCQADIMLNTPSAADYVKGYLENMDWLLNTTPAGESQTILEKSFDQGTLKTSYAHNGENYMVPLFESVNGFIYDHEIFKEKKFLIGEDGHLITSSTAALSVGRDGVAGTYDDGQPVNMSQYNEMVNAIKNSGMYTYLWSSKFSYYTEPLFWSLFYDYAGRENVDNIFKGLNGTYTNPKTNETTEITKENGYEAYKMAGYYESLKFIDDYLANPTYYHPSAAKYSTSHTDVQKVFVYGNAFDGTTADKQVAFIYEGNWWENEARANFNSLVNRGYTEYQFGTRDYRMMLPPALDEHAANGTIPLVSFDNLCISVKKQTNSEKLAAIKDFLTYFYSNEVLNDIAVSCGGLIPFETNMDEEDYAKMTKFAANMNQMYRDSNTYTVSLKYPKVQLSGGRGFIVRSGSSKTLYPIDFFLRGAGVATVCNAEDGYNNTLTYVQNKWKEIVG